MVEQSIDTLELKERLKRRSDIHLARKIWHMVGVSLIALIYTQVSESTAIILLGLAWVLLVPFDFFRQKYPSLNDLAISVFRPIMRQSEVHRFAGTSYLITGLLIVAMFFPRPVALLTMLFLAFADPIASYFGIRYGKDKIFGEKSLQGSMAAFFVCAFLTFGYLAIHGMMTDRLLMVSLLGGLIGAFSELIPIWKLDDNLTLPVLSATALWLVFTALGAFTTYL